MPKFSRMMAQSSQNKTPGKPEDFDLLIEIWRAAACEPIGLLIKVPPDDIDYWYNLLYKVRAWANDSSLFELKLGYSRFPEASLQIWQRRATKRQATPANQPSGDIPLHGLRLSDLDLPDDA